MRYYFQDETKAAAIRAELFSWEGTPFRETFPEILDKIRADLGADKIKLKGPFGGIACVSLAEESFYNIGAAAERFHFPYEFSDYRHSEQAYEKILSWLRGEADDPECKKLAAMFEEIPLPEERPLPSGFFMTGDLMIMKHQGLFHMPIVYEIDPVSGAARFMSALPRMGVTPGTIQDSSYASHLVAVFRFKAKETEVAP